jgi:hypothetical protein
MKKIFYAFFAMAPALPFYVRADAQRDSLATVQAFIKVCNDYKRLPVQLDVTICRSTNFQTSGEDSGQSTARFNLNEQGSYIEMDEVEQFANDSLILLVNKKTRRMAVFANHQTVEAQLRHYLGKPLGDSSALNMMVRYRVLSERQDGDTGTIELGTRDWLYQTGLSRETVRVMYNRLSNQPYEVVELKRSLLPVSDSLYKSMAGRPGWVGKTVSVHDSSFYLVKEVVSTFRFLKLLHESGAEPPAQIGDRIVADIPGRYRPVKAYADYVLTRPY